MLSHVEEPEREEEVEGQCQAMVMYEDEEQIMEIVPLVDPEVEEILALSLDGIEIEKGITTGCSQWVSQNIQKFSKVMGTSMEGMEAQAFLFFPEIEKRRNEKKKMSIILLKEKKKYVEGTPRALKRFESTVNYEGKRKGVKSLGGKKNLLIL